MLIVYSDIWVHVLKFPERHSLIQFFEYLENSILFQVVACHVLADINIITYIMQMEKEIKDLTKQRDLAQSRVDDLLRVIANTEDSIQEV